MTPSSVESDSNQWLVEALACRKDVKEIIKVSSSLAETDGRVFTLGSIIGKGSFGKVRKATAFGADCVQGRTLACKIIKKDDKYKHHLKNEISLLPHLKHHYMVFCEGIFDTEKEIYIFMEYYDKGTVDKFIKKEGKLDEKTTQRIFRQLVIVLCYLHSNGVCHRDLKPNNLLMDDNMNIKLGDFGLAKVCNDENGKVFMSETFCGNSKYRSPENSRREPYDPFMNDLWALGCSTYKMLTGKGLFAGAANRDELLKKQQEKLIFPETLTLSNQVKRLVANLLAFKLENRINIFGILRSCWFLYETEDMEKLPTLEKDKKKVSICRSVEFLKLVSGTNLELVPAGMSLGDHLFATFQLLYPTLYASFEVVQQPPHVSAGSSQQEYNRYNAAVRPRSRSRTGSILSSAYFNSTRIRPGKHHGFFKTLNRFEYQDLSSPKLSSIQECPDQTASNENQTFFSIVTRRRKSNRRYEQRKRNHAQIQRPSKRKSTVRGSYKELLSDVSVGDSRTRLENEVCEAWPQPAYWTQRRRKRHDHRKKCKIRDGVGL